MKLSDVKPGACYECYNGSMWLVLEVIARGAEHVKFRELVLISDSDESEGSIQEVSFHVDDPLGIIPHSVLLSEGR